MIEFTQKKIEIKIQKEIETVRKESEDRFTAVEETLNQMQQVVQTGEKIFHYGNETCSDEW